jgi:putative ABC transport system permease protein
MKWLDSGRARLRLVFGRRAAESRMHDEFRLHIEMEADQLMRTKGLSPEQARRQAIAAFGGVEQQKEAMRDGRGLAWLSGLSLDLKLGVRMLLKFPMLTVAGGLALGIAIGIGAGWYDLIGKLMAPTIPLPEGDRIVSIVTHNTLTNEEEARVVRDFLDWRRALRTIDDLGAYRDDDRNLVLGNAAPEPIRIGALTAAAFRTARVAPLLGRGLLDSDEAPGAAGVVLLGYDVWRRTLGGRQDVVGLVVKLGDTPATVIGVMPEGFAYPINHHAWTPMSLRASQTAFEGGAIGVIGRLASGVTREQADAEVRVLGERAAAALPATHAHLRPRVVSLMGGELEFGATTQLAMLNLPVLLVLAIACVSVGTLVYARTATREGEIALRTALGASRGRIVGQLFVEALVLALIAAAVGLAAANRALAWGLADAGDAPFWLTPDLKLSTIVYATGLAVVCAAMLSVLPALRATRARVQTHLANLGAGGATLRFGRVWTGAMAFQIALTSIGIPSAMENASHAMRQVGARAAFPSDDYLAARLDLDRPFDEETPSALEARRAQAFAALEQRVMQEPGVVAITFADSLPVSGARARFVEVESSPGAGSAYDGEFRTAAVGRGFFEAFDRRIVAGRAFHGGDWSPQARTVIVNEAFAQAFSRETRRGSPVGARLRFPAPATPAGASAEPWFEIVGIVRNFGLDPDELGRDAAYVFRPASPSTMAQPVMAVRTRGNPATLAARLPIVAAGVDGRLLVRGAQPLRSWIRQRDDFLAIQAGAVAGVTLLVLFLSAMGIFSLVSVSVSRRTREIGLRAALGAHPRHVLAGVVSRAVLLMVTSIVAGGALLMLFIARGLGPSGQPADDIPLFVRHLGVTSVVMLAACLLACVVPARRALSINPSEALRDA